MPGYLSLFQSQVMSKVFRIKTVPEDPGEYSCFISILVGILGREGGGNKYLGLVKCGGGL